MRKPLVYYCISTIIGCISALLALESHFIGAAFMAASFSACILFTINDKRFTVIILLFTSLSYVNYTIYFKHTGVISNDIKIRILEKERDYYIAEYKGKQIIIKGISTELHKGELIRVSGSFRKSPVLEKGIIGSYYVDNVRETNQDFIGKMYKFKRNIYKNYEKALGSKRAAMISAVCFGDITYIKKEDKEVFNKLGILHVVSVSGLHLAIIYKLLEGIGGLKLALPISLVYTLFTGAEAATLRAFIMIIIFKMAKRLFKNYDPYSALSLSAMVLIFYRPYYVTDIGFNLSFLSMLGIFIIFPKLKLKLNFLPNGLNDAISLSLSAQFLSAIYIISTMNTFSIGFMLGNIFLMPLFSALVIVGNLSVLFIDFGTIFSLFSWILQYILISIEGGSELLLKICPDIIYLNQSWSIYIVILYISYLFFTLGKRKYAYLPLIILPLLFFENYKLIPEVDYVKSGYANCTLLRYKEHNVLILDRRYQAIAENKRFNQLNKVSKVLVCGEENQYFKIDNYSITILSSSSEKEFKDILITNEFGKKILVYERDKEDKPVYNKYDIISLNSSSEDKQYGTISSVRILFGRFYIVT